jgi:hypothetical protein
MPIERALYSGSQRACQKMQQVAALAAGHEDQSSEDLRALLSLLSKKC